MKKERPIKINKKQEAIFDATLRVMAEKGFSNTRMSDISRKAGLAYGTIYYYYKNKEALFEAIVNQYYDNILRVIKEIKESDRDVYEKLRWYTLHILDTFHQSPELVHVFTLEVTRTTSVKSKRHLDRFNQFIAGINDIMLEGQEKGILRKDIKANYLTYILLGAIDCFITVMVLGSQKIKSEKQKSRIADSILKVFFSGTKTHNAPIKKGEQFNDILFDYEASEVI